MEIHDLPARVMRLNTPLVSFQVRLRVWNFELSSPDAVLMISMARVIENFFRRIHHGIQLRMVMKSPARCGGFNNHLILV